MSATQREVERAYAQVVAVVGWLNAKGDILEGVCLSTKEGLHSSKIHNICVYSGVGAHRSHFYTTVGGTKNSDFRSRIILVYIFVLCISPFIQSKQNQKNVCVRLLLFLFLWD